MIFNQLGGNGSNIDFSIINSTQTAYASTASSKVMPATITLETSVNPLNCIYIIGGRASDYNNASNTPGWYIDSVSSTSVNFANIGDSAAPAVDSACSILVIEFIDGIIKTNYFQTVNTVPGSTTTLTAPVSKTNKSIVCAIPLIRVWYSSGSLRGVYRPIYNFINTTTIQNIGDSTQQNGINNTAQTCKMQIIEFN